jgi:hypothetical protein
MLLTSVFLRAGRQTCQQGIYARFLAGLTAVKSQSPRSGAARGGGLEGGETGENHAIAERVWPMRRLRSQIGFQTAASH